MFALFVALFPTLRIDYPPSQVSDIKAKIVNFGKEASD